MVNAGNQRERGVLLRAAAPRRWEVEFARYIPAPRQAGPPAPPGLRRITRGKAAPPPRGRVAPRRVPRGAPRVEPRPPLRGPVLTVSIGDVVYIEKFAVRFPQPCDAESFLNCVKVYTSGVLQDVVAAKEMTADKVEGAGKEIDITIKRGIMPSIKAGDHLPAKMHSLVLMEEAAVTLANLEIKGQMSWPSSIAVEQTGRLFGSQTTLIPSCCRRSAMVMAEPSAVGSLGVSAICWHTDIVVATRIAAGTTQAVQRRGMPAQG
uniref:Uncharacterized protein n=1 Tax=Oryza glumipatula TaxID=40148 RepID=A0A0E0A9M2_9ORYZ